MRDAPTRFGPAEVIALTTSRRSGSALLAATRRVSERLPGPAHQRALVAAANLPPGRAEVALLRSATEEAGYLAGVLRRAHLEDELPWSRMAIIVRSTTTTLPILRRALTGAGVPVTVRGEDLPLPEQPAVAHLITALRCVLDPQRTHRAGRRTAVARPDRARRPDAASATRPRTAPTGSRRRRARRWHRCWPARSPNPAPSCCCRRDSAARWRGSRPSSPPVGRPSGPTDRPRTCCGRSGRPAGWRRSGIGRAAPAGRSERRPTAISTRCSSCSTRPPGSPIGCRRPRPASSSTNSPAPRCPATASPVAPTANRACRSSPRTRARVWSGTSSALPACRRAAGRTCACADRCSAPSCWSTSWPSAMCRRSTSPRPSWPKSAGSSTSPSPAPVAGWSSPRSAGRTSSRRASSTRSIRSSRGWIARSAGPSGASICRAWWPNCGPSSPTRARARPSAPTPPPNWPGWPQRTSPARAPTTGGDWPSCPTTGP